jgi:hypothetical protein
VSEAQPAATASIDSSVRREQPSTLSQVSEAHPAATAFNDSSVSLKHHATLIEVSEVQRAATAFYRRVRQLGALGDAERRKGSAAGRDGLDSSVSLSQSMTLSDVSIEVHPAATALIDSSVSLSQDMTSSDVSIEAHALSLKSHVSTSLTCVSPL